MVQLNTNQCNEVEMVPSDVYFEIPQSHSTFGTIDLLFDEIRPEGDKSLIKRAAFKYSRNQKTGQAYLFIICMTNKGSTRCRGSPFILEFIISRNTSDSDGVNKSSDIEGIFQIKPKKDNIQDGVSGRKRIGNKISPILLKMTVEKFMRIYPSNPNVPKSMEESRTKAAKFDVGIDINSYALVQVKGAKTVSLARVTAITATEALLEILKPKRKSPYR